MTAVAASVALTLTGVLLTGCVAPATGPTPTAVTPTAVTPSATPRPSATPTPAPSETAGPVPSPTYTEPPSKPTPEPEPVDPSAANVQILNSSYDPSAGTVRVDAQVSNLVSASGTCTLVVSQGDQSVGTQLAGAADATVTYCAAMQVTLPAGATGTWQVTVAFDDGAASGSATGEVTVS